MKRCPNCGKENHEANYICGCGHEFSPNEIVPYTESKSNEHGLYSFKGRIGRGTFWSFSFVMMIVCLILGLMIEGISSSGDEGVAIIIYILFFF